MRKKCYVEERALPAALHNRRPRSACPGSLAGVHRTNRVDQGETSEDIERLVTAFLNTPRPCAPDGFQAFCATILALNL